MSATAPRSEAARRSAARVRHHERRERRLTALHDAADRHARRLGALRLGSFVLAVALLAATAPFPEHASVLRWGALAAAVGFGIAVVLHRGPRRRARLWTGIRDAARRDLLRAQGGWSTLARDGAGLAEGCPFATDLSVVGRWSLFQAVSRCATLFGERALARALTRGVALPDVAARQDAVRELARREGFRQRLEAEGSTARHEAVAPEALRSALSGTSLHDGRPWLLPAAVGLVIVTWAQALLAYLTGWPTAFVPCLVLLAVVFVVTRQRAEAEYAPLLAHDGSLEAWSSMLALVEQHRFRSALLGELRGRLREGERASRRLGHVAAIVSALGVRNGMLHPLVATLLLWDVIQTGRLAAWRRRCAPAVAGWFEALGELEALSSLGAHAADVPIGCLPELSVDAPAFHASGLVHALLPAGEAVPNDVALDEVGSLLLLSGSNMPGKSTLLRSVGLATVLALAGGAVPARSLRLKPCALATSIHATDALDAGVSLFHAEVRRLAALLELVAAAERDPARPIVLYLIDEILRGTNTRERLMASRALLERLAGSRCAGIVTSHEIALAEVAERLPRATNAHFRETVEDGVMSFDYLMRPGPVRTSNALAVLRMEGIDLDFEETS